MMFPYTTVYHKTIPNKFPDIRTEKTWRISPAFRLEAPRFPKILRFLAFEEAFLAAGQKKYTGRGYFNLGGGENGMLASWSFVCSVHRSSSSSIVWPGALYNPIPPPPRTQKPFLHAFFPSKKGSVKNDERREK